MGNLTKNLSRYEFACDCGCGFDTIDFELVKALQHCADDLDRKNHGTVSISITGGNRCEDQNSKTEGASKSSQHVKARGSDVKYFIDGVQVDPEKVALFFENAYPNFGIGRYTNRTHLDSRSNGPARWDTRS